MLKRAARPALLRAIDTAQGFMASDLPHHLAKSQFHSLPEAVVFTPRYPLENE
jgi:hypothetical protein